MPSNRPGQHRTDFLEPRPYGYVYVGASIAPPGRAPLVRRSRELDDALVEFRGIAEELERLPAVVATTVYEAVFMPPLPGGPRFDVVLLVTTTAPEAVPDVLDSDPYRRLDGELVMTAENTSRIGETGDDPSATFLLNHFTAPDPERAQAVWEGLTRWYTDVVGVDNSTLLRPLTEAPYALVNHVRIPGGPGRFLFAQFRRPSFYRHVRGALKAEGMLARPVFYRRAFHRRA
ncbi:hypothetical protein [Nocardiopsis metallicus]|uniref:Uncharacterized protein n=1 Tax=Nocardiopsis metallicus TaxID=179819 RepID=A0A840WNY4_9ACTN|nr:hypothetical protein [Nocardiopsis metallicus]MBB5493317.1 hypothetical protein [Nocardiopsis metallicus]